jgi:hypothetical protein
MTLPFDYSRCPGIPQHPTCAHCERLDLSVFLDRHGRLIREDSAKPVVGWHISPPLDQTTGHCSERLPFIPLLKDASVS